MKCIKRDMYELSTGNTFYANCGIIGLNSDLDGISEGYDGSVWSGEWDKSFTKQELSEIADYMIKLWQDFKEKNTGD